MRICFLSLFLVHVGCSDPAQTPQTPSSGTNAGETSPNANEEHSNDEHLSVEPPDPCAEIRAEANDILQEPALACASDEDCSCYPAIIDCGGVSDNTTAQRLVEVDRRRIAADCGYRDLDGNGFNCAPWECVPECSLGRCGRGMR